MSPESRENGPSRPCRPEIVAAGLPHRGEVILERESNLYPLMVDRLHGRRGGKGGEHSAGGLTMEALESGFARREATTLPATAFLAGRCQPELQSDQERLTTLLRGVLDSLPADDLDVMAPAYVEAAMSLALRGEPLAAHRALASLVAPGVPLISQSYLAAYYLAQLGDPSGYPAMVESLRGPNEHVRLMAVRHLVAFQPYDGQAVRGQVVDVRGELVRRLGDDDAYVRVEVPYYLTEAGVEGLADLLAPVARSDRDEGVRRAARDVLERLQAGDQPPSC